MAKGSVKAGRQSGTRLNQLARSNHITKESCTIDAAVLQTMLHVAAASVRKPLETLVTQ